MVFNNVCIGELLIIKSKKIEFIKCRYDYKSFAIKRMTSYTQLLWKIKREVFRN